MGEARPRSAVHGLGRSAAWNVSASLGALGSAVGVTAIAYRYVSDDMLGAYFTVLGGQALLATLDPVVAFGVARTAARLTTTDGGVLESRIAVQRTVDGLGAVTATTLAGTALGIGLWVLVGSPTTALVAAVLLMAVALGAQLMTAVLPATATGLGDYRASSIATLGGAGVNVVVCAILVPHQGVVGLAIGLLLGVVSGRSTLLVWRRHQAPWLPLIPLCFRPAAARLLWADTRSLLLLAAASQVVTWTDMLVINMFRDSGTAAQYRLGVLVPTQAVALLFRGYDVVFPLLARGSEEEQVQGTSVLTRVFGAVAGAGLGGLIAVHSEVLHVLGGSFAQRSATVPFILFALMWAANIPAHGLSLLVIARANQHLLVPLILVETIANVALTLVLTPLFGASGSASASFITLALCNLVGVPILLRSQRVDAVRITVVEGLIPVALSLSVTVGCLMLAFRHVSSEGTRLAMSALATGAMAAMLGLLFGGVQGRKALRQSMARR